jgi:L-asparaginase
MTLLTVILYSHVSLSSVFWCEGDVDMQQSYPAAADANQACIVVLGLGGTIAGVADGADDSLGAGVYYRAAQLPIQEVLRLSELRFPATLTRNACVLETYQVAQVDSKDMGWSVWRTLLPVVRQHLARPEVRGLVITHGTDTLEETALLLHLLLPVSKPVVLTAAMRPANASEADGPQNLSQAIEVASWAAEHGHCGVVAMMAGCVWAGAEVRKAHSWQLDAFDAGGAEPLAKWVSDQLLPTGRFWPLPLDWGWEALPNHLPCVQLLTSHADADAQVVEALLLASAPRLRGVVLAGTGHGTLPACWTPPLRMLHAQGVAIWRSSRVARGGVSDARAASPSAWPAAGSLTAAQARLALALALWRCPQAVLHPPFS